MDFIFLFWTQSLWFLAAIAAQEMAMSVSPFVCLKISKISKNSKISKISKISFYQFSNSLVVEQMGILTVWQLGSLSVQPGTLCRFAPCTQCNVTQHHLSQLPRTRVLVLNYRAISLLSPEFISPVLLLMQIYKLLKKYAQYMFL